jgi:hypothetical protein
MMRPQRFLCICGITSHAKYTLLRKFSSRARCHSSRVAARKPLAGGPPALVTQISMPPNFCATAATKWLTVAASVTSKRIGKNVDVMLLLDLLRRGLQNLPVARAHGDAATLRGERFRRDTANPLTRGCDQLDSTFQSKIHKAGIINGTQGKAFTCRSSCTPLIWKRRGTL